MIADQERASHYLADYIRRIERHSEANESGLVGYYRELLKAAEEDFRAFYGEEGLTTIQVRALEIVVRDSKDDV